MSERGNAKNVQGEGGGGGGRGCTLIQTVFTLMSRGMVEVFLLEMLWDDDWRRLRLHFVLLFVVVFLARFDLFAKRINN